MGIRDSSKTRVQPVIGSLLTRPADAWLPQLLSLGSRAAICRAEGFDWIGALRKKPPIDRWFEWSAVAPVDYLKALVGCPVRLRSAVDANPKILNWSKSPLVAQKRQSLLDGEAEVVAEALRYLDEGRLRSGKGTWWVLEGTTKVDCAIFAENATIFIEGKRTEPSLTHSVAWDLQRNQVFRNLDALRMARSPNSAFFVLTIVEQDTSAAREAEQLDSGHHVARPSWPHLTDKEAQRLYEEHYLGFTTWQAVSDRFGILLEDTVEDQSFDNSSAPSFPAQHGSDLVIASTNILEIPLVFAVDVGSSSNFAWACSDGRSGEDGESLVQALVDAIRDRRKVSLGFECPLFIPVPTAWSGIGRSRFGEGNRSWSGGAGGSVTAYGLHEMAWVLKSVLEFLTEHAIAVPEITFIPEEWSARPSLLLWEAFISGDDKDSVGGHVGDAKIALAAFAEAQAGGDWEASRMVTLREGARSLNLAAFAALWAGWVIDDEQLTETTVVVGRGSRSQAKRTT